MTMGSVWIVEQFVDLLQHLGQAVDLRTRFDQGLKRYWIHDSPRRLDS